MMKAWVIQMENFVQEIFSLIPALHFDCDLLLSVAKLYVALFLLELPIKTFLFLELHLPFFRTKFGRHQLAILICPLMSSNNVHLLDLQLCLMV